MLPVRQYSDKELDILIKDAVCELVESATPPPLEESWEKFEKKLKLQQSILNKSRLTNDKSRLSLRLAIAAGFIIFLAGAFTVSFPLKARAIGEKIVDTVEILINRTQMNIKTEYKYNEPGAIPPPPEDFKELPIGQKRTVSLEEAKLISPFPVTVPHYSPAGYKLEQIYFQEMVKNTAVITLKYTNPNSNHFMISEMNIPDGYVDGYGYDIEDTVIENIEIKDIKGKIVVFKNGDIKIKWIKLGISYELEGKIKKEEAIKIFKAMNE